MIGYGEMLLEAAWQTEHAVEEFRPASLFGRLLSERFRGTSRKLANNLDRFVVTPLQLAGSKADIVHVVDPGNAVYLPLIRHRRSIVTVHDMIPYLARDGKLPGWQPTRTGRWLMNRIITQLAKVDHIICPSHTTKRDLLAYVDLPEERVSVVHNVVFQEMAQESPEACSDLRARLGVPQEVPLILHVGRNFYKNRTTVLESFARVRMERQDTQLVLVGALEPALRARADQLGILDAMHVLDFISRKDMPALYTTSSVLFFPSLYEGFGLPVLEAQLCGTPVVCSDAGSLPEVVGDQAITCAPHDVDGFLGALLQELAVPRRLGSPPHNVAAWSQDHHRLYDRLGKRSNGRTL